MHIFLIFLCIMRFENTPAVLKFRMRMSNALGVFRDVKVFVGFWCLQAFRVHITADSRNPAVNMVLEMKLWVRRRSLRGDVARVRRAALCRRHAGLHQPDAQAQEGVDLRRAAVRAGVSDQNQP